MLRPWILPGALLALLGCVEGEPPRHQPDPGVDRPDSGEDRPDAAAAPQDAAVEPSDQHRPDTGAGEPGPGDLPEPDHHRPVAEVCAPERPTGSIRFLESDAAVVECRAHEDCADGINGRCTAEEHASGTDYFCTYDGCSQDSDCGDGVCDCGEFSRYGQNRCVAGDCRVDADCGPNGYGCRS